MGVTGCEGNWEKHGSNCYLWSQKDQQKLDWYDAEAFCKKEGGHLASVTSEATNEYIFEGKRERSLANIWLGGSDQPMEGVWKWSDGTPWKFELWNDKEPSKGGGQDCLIQLGYNVKGWKDYGCTYVNNFVCSQPKFSGNNINISEFLKNRSLSLFYSTRL